jgi:hypothetical protein
LWALEWCCISNRKGNGSASPDEYQLENIALDHLIGVGIFIPFVIARLAENAQQTEALLTIRLRNSTDQTETEHRLRLTWSLDNLAARSLGVSERVITEWAACGVACVVLARYTSFASKLANYARIHTA